MTFPEAASFREGAAQPVPFLGSPTCERDMGSLVPPRARVHVGTRADGGTTRSGLQELCIIPSSVLQGTRLYWGYDVRRETEQLRADNNDSC